MGSGAKLTKSFRRVESQKLGLSFLAVFLLLTLTLVSLSEPIAIPMPTFDLRSTNWFPAFLVAQDAGGSQTLGSEEKVVSRIEEVSLLSLNGSADSGSAHGDNLDSNLPGSENKNVSRIEEVSLLSLNGSANNGSAQNGDLDSNLPGSENKNVSRNEEVSLLSPNGSVDNGSAQDGDLDSNLLDAKNKRSMPEEKLQCDFSDRRFDLCELEGDIRIHGNSSVLFIPSTQATTSQTDESWLIRPHPRKFDNESLVNVRPLSVKSVPDRNEAPRCTVNHSFPAVIFSTGGYMGNIFHDFTDVLVPVFLTSRQYNGEVQFLVSDRVPWWFMKYETYFKQLSRYELIDFDKEERVHCYPHVTVGLRSHKEMSIDSWRAPHGSSMVDFAALMRTTYSLERESAIKLGASQSKKPRLLIIARKGTRSFKNLDEIIRMAEGLGYEVVTAETDAIGSLDQYAKVVNSCDVMMGVHGAGLTNLVFLPNNATVIQIVPFGGLGKYSWDDFGDPSLDRRLSYLQYEVSEEESTLTEIYPRDHPVFKDPGSIHKQGWSAISHVYMNQSVRLDVENFSGYLMKALGFLHQ